MKIKINDQEHELHFGLDFIEMLDEDPMFKNENTAVSVGTQLCVGFLADTRNPKYLVPIIKAAIDPDDMHPTDREIKIWIESQKDISGVIEAFLMQLQKLNLFQDMVNWENVIIKNNNALKNFKG